MNAIKVFLFMLFAMMFSPATFAASYIDPAVSGVFTQVEADVTTMSGYSWVLLGMVFGIGVAMKLFSKFGHKGLKG